MKKLVFSTVINAPASKVWQVLWNDTFYRQWTSVFSDGSYAVSTWNEGDKIHFLSPEGSGMNSIIDKKEDEKYMAFKHIGEIKNFKELPLDEKTKKWSGSMEIYSLSEVDGKTTLNAELDSDEEFGNYFSKTFPKALEKVKQLAENKLKPAITVLATINADVNKVWDFWNNPTHITKWCQASPDWHAPFAENDLKVGGKFKTTMAAKDGSFSFDFGGVYTVVEKNKSIEYKMSDERKVEIRFTGDEKQTKIVETFEPESENSDELQRGGWQAILNSFKNYVETN